MESDAFSALEARQREMWKSFCADRNLHDAGGRSLGAFRRYHAITAARAGAKVCALDLTPELLREAEQNAKAAGMDVAWGEGDAEKLPYPDASFDVVLSQFGHMFAPRPDVAVSEMRRVLKPNGRVAFATWPREELIGKIFTFIGRNSPPPGAEPPPKWGVQSIIVERR